MPQPTLYTADQAGAELGITGRRVRQMAEAHGIGTRLGDKTLIFYPADLDRLRQRNTRRGPKPKIAPKLPVSTP